MNTPTTTPRANLTLVLFLTAIACVATVLLRLNPPLFNFAPVGALCLFLGARLRSWWAVAIPLALLLGTDYLIYQGKPDMTFWHDDTPFVYASFVLVFAMGRFGVGSSENPLRILGVAVAAGVPFFLITNFGPWYNVAIAHTVVPVPGLDDYSADLSGLLRCYLSGLPFHRGTLLGDVVFSAALFGAYALAVRRVSASGQTQEALP